MTAVPIRSLFLSFLLIFGGFAANAHAQVRASLVSPQTSIQPGEPFTVALRLNHDPTWHTYWINPGTGYPTTLKWDLPPGWTASEIRWPAPIVIKDRIGNIIGNGYEHIAYLPVEITPPADLQPGSPVILRALAEWLMCADVCIPGESQVSLELPVSADPPQPSSGAGAEAAATVASLPREVPGWGIEAERNGDKVVLRLTPSSDVPHAEPTDLRFFASDAFIQYDQPQAVRTGEGGEIVIEMPVSPSANPTTERLVGVLTTPGGWFRGIDVKGMTIDVPLTTGAIIASTEAGPGSLAGTLLLAFVGGLILNLMPCVFPVLGIKILGFVNQAGSDRRKVTTHGLVFTMGVLASFWVLAGVLALLRAGGDQLGWGFQLQSPVFIFVLAALLLVFALSLSGVFEFGLRATGVGSRLQTRGGYTGSFFTGVLATVVATPCSAPFLAPALGAALALPLVDSFAVFTAIAVGLSTPYLLLSIFPQAIKVLPRPGAWMETFKQAMAFPLYATVVFLVWVLAGQVSEGGLLFALLGLTLIAMGAWLHGRFGAPGSTLSRARVGLAGGVFLMLAGTLLGWPRPPTIVWEEWSPERVAQLQAEGRPIYVDFTARWCFTCQTNKNVVFSSEEVKSTFADKKVALLRADWTNQDPRITAELAKWNRSAVPFNLVYLPDEAEPRVLPELLTPGIVLEAVSDT